MEIYTHALSLPLTYIKTITKVHRTSITNIPTVFSIPASNVHNVGLKGIVHTSHPWPDQTTERSMKRRRCRMNDLKKEGRVYWLHYTCNRKFGWAAWCNTSIHAWSLFVFLSGICLDQAQQRAPSFNHPLKPHLITVFLANNESLGLTVHNSRIRTTCMCANVFSFSSG